MKKKFCVILLNNSLVEKHVFVFADNTSDACDIVEQYLRQFVTRSCFIIDVFEVVSNLFNNN